MPLFQDIKLHVTPLLVLMRGRQHIPVPDDLGEQIVNQEDFYAAILDQSSSLIGWLLLAIG